MVTPTAWSYKELFPSISTFETPPLRNHKARLARLKETKTPEILTVNGRAQVVIQDAESYQDFLDQLHHMETRTAIHEGMARAERGEGKPAEQVFSEMQAKYGLHGSSPTSPLYACLSYGIDHCRMLLYP